MILLPEALFDAIIPGFQRRIPGLKEMAVPFEIKGRPVVHNYIQVPCDGAANLTGSLKFHLSENATINVPARELIHTSYNPSEGGCTLAMIKIRWPVTPILGTPLLRHAYGKNHWERSEGDG